MSESAGLSNAHVAVWQTCSAHASRNTLRRKALWACNCDNTWSRTSRNHANTLSHAHNLTNYHLSRNDHNGDFKTLPRNLQNNLLIMLTYAGSIVTCFASISLLFWKFVSLHAGTERCIFVTTQVTSILASRTGKWYLNCQNWTGGVLDSYVRRTTNTSLSNHATYWHPMSWTRLTSYHNLNVALEEKKLHYLTGMDRLMQRTTICQRIKKIDPSRPVFIRGGNISF